MRKPVDLDVEKRVDAFLEAVVPDSASHVQIKEAAKAMDNFAKDLKKSVDKCAKG